MGATSQIWCDVAVRRSSADPFIPPALKPRSNSKLCRLWVTACPDELARLAFRAMTFVLLALGTVEPHPTPRPIGPPSGPFPVLVRLCSLPEQGRLAQQSGNLPSPSPLPTEEIAT